MALNQVGNEIWIYEGTTVSFYGFPFPTRMTVVRLGCGDLWIHSPEKLNPALQQELSELGTVKYLISPNKLHHLFIKEWSEAFPKAMNYAAPGLAKKRNDISFDGNLSNTEESFWAKEIKQTIFRGSPILEEVVFFHKPSSTLILTDLIENFDSKSLSWWQRKLAGFAGILSPNGKTPIDWRLSFAIGNKIQARESLGIIIEWNPENIILSHGVCIFGQGTEFVRSSFSWLANNQ